VATLFKDLLVRASMGLAATLAMMAWLLPNHVEPWGSFYNEAAMGLALVALFPGLLAMDRSRVQWPLAACVFLGLAAVPWVQRATGQIRFDGDALLASLYLAGLAFAVVAGRRWQQLQGDRAAAPVFAILLAGAVASTCVAFTQWLQLDWIGLFAADLPPLARPSANLAQPNLLATLLFWGLVAVWGLYLGRKLNGAVATSLAAWLILGLAMTQSRTAWLEMGLLAVVAIAFRARLQGRRSAPVLVSLALLYLLLVWAWPTINHALHIDGGLTLSDQMRSGRRPLLWRMMLDALRQSPWLGYGWTQVGLAHQAMAPQYPDLAVLFTYAHNLWLDLCIWNGVPIGLALSALVLWWLASGWRRVRTAEQVLLLAAVTGFVVHCQLELPHAYAFFCLPVGFIVGMLAPDADGWKPSWSRTWSAACVAALAVVLLAVSADYGTAEEGWRQARGKARGITGSQVQSLPRWLDPLAALVTLGDQVPDAGTTPAQQARFRRAVERFPGATWLYQLAQLDRSAGRGELAERDLQVLCAINIASVCDGARRAWATEVARKPQGSGTAPPMASAVPAGP
jgi:O-antigen ligase